MSKQSGRNLDAWGVALIVFAVVAGFFAALALHKQESIARLRASARPGAVAVAGGSVVETPDIAAPVTQPASNAVAPAC